MNYHNIPTPIKLLSSLSVSSILWCCLLGLELKKAFDAKFSITKLFTIAKDGTDAFGFNNDVFSLLYNESLSLQMGVAFLLSIIATAILAAIVKRKILAESLSGEIHRVHVIKFIPYENELLLKSSALITIITVLHTASNDLALIATVLLSIYSPIWPYNSLIQFRGLVFAKASVILDVNNNVYEEFVVITTKEVISNFTYNPSEPERMDILLHNKISIIR